MPPKAKKKVAAPASSLAQLRGNLEKRYGNQVVRRDQVTPYEVIPTGSLTLDLATRVGGWIRGRLHEIVGPEGVGKTTLAICSAIEAQHLLPKLAVGYIDMEQTFDYDWAEALGLDTSGDRWFHIYPDDSEDVADVLRKQVETGLFSMVAVDSIGGMESKQAFEKESGDQVMGRNAMVITRMVKQSAVLARRNKTAVLLVNQYRANFGSPNASDISAGPKAMKYSTTMRVDMSGTSDDPIRYTLPGDTEPVIIGRKVRARVSRNKVAVQGKRGEFFLINADTSEYGPVGIDQADEAITIGLYTEVIEQRGAWYYLPLDEGQEKPTRVQGREALAIHLRSCPDDQERVRGMAIASMAGDVREETEVVLEHEVRDG